MHISAPSAGHINQAFSLDEEPFHRDFPLITHVSTVQTSPEPFSLRAFANRTMQLPGRFFQKYIPQTQPETHEQYIEMEGMGADNRDIEASGSVNMDESANPTHNVATSLCNRTCLLLFSAIFLTGTASLALIYHLSNALSDQEANFARLPAGAGISGYMPGM